MSLRSTYPPSAPTAPRTGISPTMSPTSIYQQTSTRPRHCAHPRRILSCPRCTAVSTSYPPSASLLAFRITSACLAQLCYRHLPIHRATADCARHVLEPLLLGKLHQPPLSLNVLPTSHQAPLTTPKHHNVSICFRYAMMEPKYANTKVIQTLKTSARH